MAAKINIMKRTFLVLNMLVISLISAAQPNYKVVFDVTSQDTTDHKLAIRWANEVLKAEPTAQIEIVLFGKSLAMITNQRSIVAADITRLTSNKNASVKVCQVAMKANNVDMSQLVPGVQTVPDGIYEIISKQRQGWGYIKVSH